MQRIIVGTGRCGSTLLSNLLAHHPDVFMVQELFGGMEFDMLHDGQVTGSELASLLLRDHLNSNLNISRANADREIVLDKSALGQRIPKPMLATLPHWTSDVAGLMREIVDWARAQKTRTLSEHYPALFDWLTALFKKKFWIERSGGSAEYFPALCRTFPDARYLHLHRDGCETALSMRDMAYFATHISFYFNPPSDQEMLSMIRNENPPESDPFALRLQNKLSPELYGQFWTTSICILMSQVGYLNRDQYREFRYEDLRADPPAFLKQVCDYFEVSSDKSWIDKAVTTIRPEAHNRTTALSAGETAKLKAAVLHGEILIKREGMRSSPNFEMYARMRKIWDEVAPAQ